MKRPNAFVLPLRRKGRKGPEPCPCAACCAAQPWRQAFKDAVAGELRRRVTARAKVAR